MREAIAIAGNALPSAEGMALQVHQPRRVAGPDRPAARRVARRGGRGEQERARSLGVEQDGGLLRRWRPGGRSLGRLGQGGRKLLDTGSARDQGGLAGVRLTIQQVPRSERGAGTARRRMARAPASPGGRPAPRDGGSSGGPRGGRRAGRGRGGHRGGALCTRSTRPFRLATDGPPDPALAQLAATGLQVEADAAAAARARHDAMGVDTVRGPRQADRGVGDRRGTPGRPDHARRRRPRPAGRVVVARIVAFRFSPGRLVVEERGGRRWLGVAAAWEAIGRPFPAAQALRAAAATLGTAGRGPTRRRGSWRPARLAARLDARPLLADIDRLAGERVSTSTLQLALDRRRGGARPRRLTDQALESSG